MLCPCSSRFCVRSVKRWFWSRKSVPRGALVFVEVVRQVIAVVLVHDGQVDDAGDLQPADEVAVLLIERFHVGKRRAAGAVILRGGDDRPGGGRGAGGGGGLGRGCGRRGCLRHRGHGRLGGNLRGADGGKLGVELLRPRGAQEDASDHDEAHRDDRDEGEHDGARGALPRDNLPPGLLPGLPPGAERELAHRTPSPPGEEPSSAFFHGASSQSSCVCAAARHSSMILYYSMDGIRRHAKKVGRSGPRGFVRSSRTGVIPSPADSGRLGER